MTKMDDQKSRALRTIAQKAESLPSPKWMDLDSARIQVALYLLSPDEAVVDDADDDIDREIVNEVLRRAGIFLIEAFAAGDLRTRGVEHLRDAPPVLHRRLPPVWWERVFENADDVPEDDLDFPVHLLSWEASKIVRWPDTAQSAVTNIKVEVARLDRIAPPNENGTAEAVRRRMGRKPEQERIAKVQKIAKAIVVKKFGTFAAFASEVTGECDQHDPDANLTARQIGRWVFGDK